MLTVTGAEILDNEALIDALKRYKIVNGRDYFDIAKTEPFFRAIETFSSDKRMRIALQENAVKVRLNYKGDDFVIDYNFEEPDNVFILSRRDEKLISMLLKHFSNSPLLRTFMDSIPLAKEKLFGYDVSGGQTRQNVFFRRINRGCPRSNTWGAFLNSP